MGTIDARWILDHAQGPGLASNNTGVKSFPFLSGPFPATGETVLWHLFQPVSVLEVRDFGTGFWDSCS